MLRLSVHAAARCAERGIALAWVQPDPSDPSLTRSFKAIDAAGGRILRVVHRPDGADLLVITAFFDRDAGS